MPARGQQHPGPQAQPRQRREAVKGIEQPQADSPAGQVGAVPAARTDPDLAAGTDYFRGLLASFRDSGWQVEAEELLEAVGGGDVADLDGTRLGVYAAFTHFTSEVQTTWVACPGGLVLYEVGTAARLAISFGWARLRRVVHWRALGPQGAIAGHEVLLEFDADVVRAATDPSGVVVHSPCGYVLRVAGPAGEEYDAAQEELLLWFVRTLRRHGMQR